MIHIGSTIADIKSTIADIKLQSLQAMMDKYIVNISTF